MRLKDKVAIVTGGGVGIGKAYAHGLAKEGAKVVVADIQDGEAKKVAADIKSGGGDALSVYVDVTSMEKPKRWRKPRFQPTAVSIFWSTTPDSIQPSKRKTLWKSMAMNGTA
jgi:NAD(P)-dependent dehydrogenase (short-subunit alcohol dehydrogenase family)